MPKEKKKTEEEEEDDDFPDFRVLSERKTRVTHQRECPI